MLLFQVKAQPASGYKKHVIFLSSKNEENSFPHKFISVFTWYFIGAISSKKCCQKRGFRKKIKRWESHTGELSIEGGEGGGGGGSNPLILTLETSEIPISFLARNCFYLIGE